MYDLLGADTTIECNHYLYLYLIHDVPETQAFQKIVSLLSIDCPGIVRIYLYIYVSVSLGR